MKRVLKRKGALVRSVFMLALVMCMTVFSSITASAALSEEAHGKNNNGSYTVTLSEKTQNGNLDAKATQLKQALDKADTDAALTDSTNTSQSSCFTISGKEFTINSESWGKLTKDEQEKVLNIIAGSEYYGSLTDSDQSCIIDGFKQTGTKDGTTLMTILFGNTKPNWVSAYKIIAPFNGPVGTILGAGTMFMALALIVVILCDVFYMTIPWFRVKGDSKDDIRWVSFEAKQAVEKVEGGGDGKKSQVLWEYLKHKVVMLFLFGLCILYLLCGNIFQFLGYLLDLASGTM